MDLLPIYLTVGFIAILMWGISILIKGDKEKPVEDTHFAATDDKPTQHRLACRYHDHYTPFDDDYQFSIEDGQAIFSSPSGQVVERRTLEDKTGVFVFRYNHAEYIATVHP